MDGTRLAHEAHALPKLQALNTTTSVDKPKARGRIIAVICTLVLAGVMALVYYVSIRQPPRTTAVAISPTEDAAPTNAQASPAPASAQSDGSEKAAAEAPAENSTSRDRTTPGPAATESDTVKPDAKPSPKTATTGTTKATSQTRSTTQSAGSTAKPEDKDPLKVKSALKKTGRFFKKALPF